MVKVTNQEAEVLSQFLGMCGDVEMPNNNNLVDIDDIDIASANRDELIKYCLQIFKFCQSYHRSVTPKMLAMLSNVLLRHFASLLQELVDPHPGRETNFNLQTAEEDNDESNFAIVQSDSSGLVLASDTQEILSPEKTPPLFALPEDKDRWSDGT